MKALRAQIRPCDRDCAIFMSRQSPCSQISLIKVPRVPRRKGRKVPGYLFARGQPRAIMDDLVRDAIFKILKPLKDRDNISRKEAERIEDDVAESVSIAF